MKTDSEFTFFIVFPQRAMAMAYQDYNINPTP